jgi:integrase
MAVSSLKGVNVVTKKRADGSVYRAYYHRASGKRLRGEPNSAEFQEDFAAAEGLHSRAERHTLAELIDRFHASAEFDDLAETTKAEYLRKLLIIRRRFGHAPTELLESRSFRGRVLDWRDEVARTSGKREADNLVSAIARVQSWALNRGAVKLNVMTSVAQLWRSDRSEKIWTPAHIRLWMSAAPPEMKTAMLLALGTAQRRGDLVEMKWSQYDGRVIRLAQRKTGAVLEIPAVNYLREHLDGLERRSDYILTNTRGRPWTGTGLSQTFLEVSRSVGIKDLHFHDLRGTAVTMLADAGASVPQIAAMTGHSLDGVGRILAVYLKPTIAQAQGAVAALEKLGFDPLATAAHQKID